MSVLAVTPPTSIVVYRRFGGTYHLRVEEKAKQDISKKSGTLPISIVVLFKISDTFAIISGKLNTLPGYTDVF
jgi:hypothetical protein